VYKEQDGYEIGFLKGRYGLSGTILTSSFLGAVFHFRLVFSSSFFGSFVPHLRAFTIPQLEPVLCTDAHDSVTLSCINIFPFVLLHVLCVLAILFFFFFAFFGLSFCFVFSASEFSEFSEF